jgi:hypothetical protein
MAEGVEAGGRSRGRRGLGWPICCLGPFFFTKLKEVYFQNSDWKKDPALQLSQVFFMTARRGKS